MSAQIVSLDSVRSEHPFALAIRAGYGRIVARALSNEVLAGIARGESRQHAIARVIRPKSASAHPKVSA